MEFRFSSEAESRRESSSAQAIKVQLRGNQMMKKMLVVIAAVVVFAGCNTMAGAGKDMEAGGRAVEKAADDTKKKM
jgi:predicted small secreted protein